MSYQQTEVNSLASECFEMQFSDTDAIKLNNVMSILNSEGEQLKPYNVTIKNICDNDIKYQVNIETLTNKDKLADKYITAKVNYEDNKVLTSYDSTEGIIPDHSAAYKVYEGHLKKDQVMSIDVRMWMGEEVELYETVDGVKVDKSKEIMNKEFQSKVTIEAEVENQTGEYKEEILHGTDPVIKGDLIPVTIGENGKVTRADTTKKWYNYANSEWANAVILAEGKEDPGAGKPISEDDIESYFVWIPKYSYQIQTLGLSAVGQEKAFSIRFGTDDTKDETKGECTTPMNEDKTQGKSGDNGECQVGDFMTHPAFLSFGANGLWIGKFETGYKDAQSKEEAEDFTNTNQIATERIIIKPNVYSWRAINVSHAFENSIKYQTSLESHLMKNTEWGAVAYLIQSIYGRCNSNGTCEEVMINNNRNKVTGYSSDQLTEASDPEAVDPKKDGTITFNYNNPKSVNASTTGNYTGIYDMSGGAYEFVFSIVFDSEGDKPIYMGSGFSESYFPDGLKYYDKYKNNSLSTDYTQKILGDATAETKGWNGDDANFPNLDHPWLYRGGSSTFGSNLGIFVFTSSVGGSNIGDGFRIVLAPQS